MSTNGSDPSKFERTPYEDFITGQDYGTQNRLELRIKGAALFDLAARLGEERDPCKLCF